jgi:hypothetical protein
MRALQFWILLLVSSFVSLLLIDQIFLSRALNRQQRMLVDSEEIVSSATAYENNWKQLAIHIYQASRQDPALVEVLKNEGVSIHSGVPPAAGSPTSTAPSAPPASSKTPVTPSHPATP